MSCQIKLYHLRQLNAFSIVHQAVRVAGRPVQAPAFCQAPIIRPNAFSLADLPSPTASGQRQAQAYIASRDCYQDGKANV